MHKRKALIGLLVVPLSFIGAASSAPTAHAASTSTILTPITASSITATSAVVSWYTNINSDTQVGLSTATTSAFSTTTGTTVAAASSSNITSGLVGYWPLDADSKDWSGNGNNGSWSGASSSTYATHYSPGKIGNWAGYFNGVNNYVTMSSMQSVAPTTTMTMSAWFDSTNAKSAGARIFTKGGCSSAVDWLIGQDNGGGKLWFQGNIGGAFHSWESSTTLQNNTWYLTTLTYDGSYLDFYLNGVLDKSIAATGTIADDTQQVVIGACTGGGSPFPGQIDDVRLYNRILSPAEIQSLYGDAALYQHSATLGNLNSRTTYYYQVSSTGASTTVSDNNNGSYFSFTTGQFPPPTITSFSMPSIAASTTVPVTAFAATTSASTTISYLITQSSSTPATNDPGWSSTPPSSFTFSSNGDLTAYAWVEDAQGDISSTSATVLVNGLNFTYTLASAGVTSAGVYTDDASSTLVRTLWSGRSESAGTHTAFWDGILDDGSTSAPSGSYVIKVLYNDVQYTWEGVIGNTTSTFGSTTAPATVWRSLYGIHDLAFSPSTTEAIAPLGYNEQEYGVLHFDTSDPQTPYSFFAADQNETWTYAATDGTRTYLADTGVTWDHNNSTFVYSFDMSGNPVGFTNGSIATTSSGDSYPKAIDIAQEPLSSADTAFTSLHAATGLAVQASGSVLAVAHGPLNVIDLYDKTSGSSLGSISVNDPGQVGFAANGDLWAIVGSTTAERFASSTLGSTNTAIATVTGLAFALGLAVDPTTGDVVIADGGTSQQVKAFDASGNALWTLGAAGGYNAANGPAVTNDKFQFMVSNSSSYNFGDPAASPYAFVAFQPDGSFWVDDGGDRRIMHFSSSRSYLGQIAYVTDNQKVAVDPNDPNRVFALGFLEYRFDYTKALQPGDPDTAFGGDGSWKLVNNWSAGMDLSTTTGYGGLIQVATLTSNSQTRTYGLLIQNSNSHNYAVAELPSSGPMRLIQTGGTQAYWLSWMAPNGDLRSGIYNSSTGGFQVTSNVFAGIDGSGNPIWNATTTIASTTIGQGDPYEYNNVTSGGLNHLTWSPPRVSFPITDNDTIAVFTPGQGTTTYPDYHLGGIPVGGTAYRFKTSKTGNISVPDGQGTFTNQSAFGGHAGAQAWSVGDNIVWTYDGQYGTYSNQFAHYYDDGLFVGQFGVAEPSGLSAAQIAAMVLNGFTSNFGETAMVKGTDGNIYVFVADESSHSGIHVWKISNASSIVEYSSKGGTLGQAAILTVASPAAKSSGSSNSGSGSSSSGGSVTSSGSSGGYSPIPIAVNGTTAVYCPIGFTCTVAAKGAGTAPAPASAYSFQALLDRGSSGAGVSALQELLARLGFFSQEPTGFFGPVTERAVKAYQASRGIASVGWVGPETRASLNADAAAAPSSAPAEEPAPSSGILSISRDLTLGSQGSDVKSLQEYLNSHGHPVASSGVGSAGRETADFGPLTRKALASFQEANGISPAAGYFGPKTRAWIASHP
ncbi:MAG: peptidoglycan-binding protein [Patescibacteria group bacterium]|nr:peptidoglycan-binding protein [Patescibacteria group bacterium]